MAGKRIMLIAGEASGDLLAAELVRALRRAPELTRTPFPPEFFGAGGPQMAAAGVELAFDLTRHSVVGLSDVLKELSAFKRCFDELLHLAVTRQPDAIVCVDFSGFNRRFGHAARSYVRARHATFNNWEPKLVQYVSPQVWASRPGRAWKMARDFDLLLCLLPFEQAWYARRVPAFHVEFVGHPILERHRAGCGGGAAPVSRQSAPGPTEPPLVLLLPGSRTSELKRHLPPLLGAAKRIRTERPEVRLRMVVPSTELARQALAAAAQVPGLEIRTDDLADSLSLATTAIASTGTVTLECALFGVPTVAMYRTSWSSYCVARSIVTVNYLAMPNLLAGEEVFPEFVQGAASPANLAKATLALLNDPSRRAAVRAKLETIVKSLGGPGASDRTARAIARLIT